MGNLWRDIGYSLRMLKKNPGFSAIAILVLALGIGANTAIFGLINFCLLQPIVAKNPSELVACYNGNTASPYDFRRVSYPNYRDLRENNHAFSGLLAHELMTVGLTEGKMTRTTMADIISSNYFDVYGVSLFKGRAFRLEEEVPGSGIPVVIVGYGFWKKHGEDPNLIGKTLRINGQFMTIVGIAPQGFSGRPVLLSREIYLPIGMYHLFSRRNLGQSVASRDAPTFLLEGRLKPGITIANADAQLKMLSAQLAEDYPTINKGYCFFVRPLPPIYMDPDPNEGGEGTPLGATMLMAMSGIVLLIACINLANMLLARGESRRREIAIRIAIGGSRARILRQLLTDGLVLSLIGGIAGLIIADWGDRLLITSLSQSQMVQEAGVNITFQSILDHRVLLVTLFFCILATILFSLGPAWKLSKPDIIANLKEKTGKSPARNNRVRFLTPRNLLLISQIALSLVLLTTAGLFIQIRVRAAVVKPGFSIDNGIVVAVSPVMAGYDQKRSREVCRTLLSRIKSIPGVEAAGMSTSVPFGDTLAGREVRRAEPNSAQAGGGSKDAGLVNVLYASIGNDYFNALGIPILRGRDFTSAESEYGSNSMVAIVDTAMAKMLWTDADPIGRRIEVTSEKGVINLEIVGVVPTVLYELHNSDSRPHLYVPYGHDEQLALLAFTPHIFMRTNADKASILKAVQSEIRTVDEQLPILKLTTAKALLSDSISYYLIKTGANIFSMFGGLALFLAVVGIYGVNAYSVAQRTKEIGIRLALGATPLDMVRLILREGLILTLAGSAIGLILGIGVSKLLGSMIYGVDALNLIVFSIAALVLGSAALLAAYIPARRASRVDPIVALHYE
jgi:predicted permease